MATPYQPRSGHERCFQCFWRGFREFSKSIKNKKIYARPRIDCITSSATRKSCDHCEGLRNPCEKIADGMQGDAFDTVALLDWLDAVNYHIIVNQQTSALADFWTKNEKKKLMEAGLKLANAFKAAEKAHRIEHNIRISKMQRIEAGSDVAYDNFVVVRRALQGTDMLRLQLNDRGHAAWQLAKLTFALKVSKMMDKDATQKLFLKSLLPPGIISIN